MKKLKALHGTRYTVHIIIKPLRLIAYINNNMRKCIIKYFAKTQQHLTILSAVVFGTVVTGNVFQMLTAWMKQKKRIPVVVDLSYKGPTEMIYEYEE